MHPTSKRKEHESDGRGVSASYTLDIEKRKRTFSEEQQTCSALIGKVLQAYPGSDMIYYTGGGEAVGEPILQYEETDWELLQRLASRLQAVVVCDILEGSSMSQAALWHGSCRRM